MIRALSLFLDVKLSKDDGEEVFEETIFISRKEISRILLYAINEKKFSRMASSIKESRLY